MTMNDAAASQPVTQELLFDATPDQAAALLAERRNAQALTGTPPSVETPVPDDVIESTVEPELVADAEAGLPVEPDAEPAVEPEPEAGQPEEIVDEVAEGEVLLLDGQEIELDTIREWQKGHMKDSDYRQKTEAIAEERKVLNQSGHELDRLAQMYAYRIGEMNASVNNDLEQFNGLDWPELAKNDPAQYTAVKAQHDAILQRQQQVNQRQQEFLTHQDTLRKQHEHRQAEQSKVDLKNRMPDWNDAVYYKLIDFGTEHYKFDREQMLRWTDAGTFECMRDAMRYREGLKVATKKAVRTTPRKTLTARATAPATPKAIEKIDTAMGQLETSGSLDDAVKAFQARRNARVNRSA